jgi:hypothetical protein
LTEIQSAVSNFDFKDLQVIFVNDHSDDNTVEILQEWITINQPIPNFYSIVNNDSNFRGISGSLFHVSQKLISNNYSQETQITEIPGNDQLDEDEISKLIRWGINNTGQTLVTFRTNQNVRPRGKVLFSLLLQWVIRNFVIRGVCDITANYVFPLKLIDKKFPLNWGHAFGLWILHSSYKNKIIISQLPIELKSGIAQRLSSKSSRKFPRIKNVFEVLYAIISFLLKGYRFKLIDETEDANRY